MNKKLIAVLALAIAPMGVALADNDAGCGLGTKAWKGERGVLYKILALLTNATGLNTFAISSGTLGCDGQGTITAHSAAIQFASGNMDALSADMARGEGEALTTVAAIYGIELSDRETFYALTQSNYGAIFNSADVTSVEVVASVRELMAKDTRLARYVA